MMILNQPSRGTYSHFSRGPQPAVLFGHAPKPQPEDTKEWLQTFALDLFKPHKIIPKKPGPNDPPDPLADKNVLQKVCLWFQTLADSFFKDLKHIWQHCRPKSKPQ